MNEHARQFWRMSWFQRESIVGIGEMNDRFRRSNPMLMARTDFTVMMLLQQWRDGKLPAIEGTSP